MSMFFVYAISICVGCFLLLIVPVLRVPGLARPRKLLISLAGFLILVPFALLLYGWLGVPSLANG